MRFKKSTHYKIFFIIIFIFIFFLIISTWNFNAREIKWGITFSKKHAAELGLNWWEVYDRALNELVFIKTIRLPIYWPEVEKNPGQYDFTEYDWMIKEAEKKNIEIMPVLGRRVPRWPECHTPTFYQALTEAEIKTHILNLLTAEINHFKNFNNIKKWQIDNEPFADFFGECPIGDINLVNEEINLVKSLDTRPIVITESGELSNWLKGAKLADILGVSMYRQTWNKNWGWFNYPLPPAYYFFKTQINKLLTPIKKIISTELQVEPWAKHNDMKNMTLFDQYYTMDLNQIKSNLKFAKKSGFDEIYLWGIEWWWWLGVKHNNWTYWEYGKNLK
ncbi:MAG TPA: hypothetical protein PKZ16_02855 [bacterium]|nr:hypothetical protein [bacterium]HPL95363.1 hypothetical protein [bacterium]